MLRHMRHMLVAALLFAFAIAALPALSQPAPYRLDILLSETGAGTFLGTKEHQALTLLEKVVNENGGINGRPVQFVYADDQSNPVVAVQLANSVAARGAPVVLGPSLVGSCSAMLPMLEKNGLVNFCYSNALNAPPRSFAFSASAGSAPDAIVIIRYFREHGWTRIGFIAGNDVAGRVSEGQVDAALALPENRDVKVVLREFFNPQDISVNAQLVKIKDTHPQALFTTASGTSFGTIMHAMHDSGLDVPTYSSSANMVESQLIDYAGILPRDLFFVTSSGVIPDPNFGTKAVKEAQRIYFQAFARAGLTPNSSAILCWDPTMIVIDALRHTGPNPTAAKVHDYIENLHGWAGIEGLYDFRDGTQRGVGLNSLLVYRWDGPTQKVQVVSRAAGLLK
jgi:branched-chain amino acid transport system substrate-binding protein